MKGHQMPLLVAPHPLTAFQRETLRRGGPLEVMGKRWRRKLRSKQEAAVLPQVPLPSLGMSRPR